MPYGRVDDRLHGHRKAKVTSDAALGLWVRGLSYASCYLTDGYLDEAFVADFIRGRARQRAAQELVDRGWWIPEDGGYRMAGYLDHNLSRADVEKAKEDSRVRQERLRARRRQTTLPWAEGVGA